MNKFGDGSILSLGPAKSWAHFHSAAFDSFSLRCEQQKFSRSYSLLPKGHHCFSHHRRASQQRLTSLANSKGRDLGLPGFRKLSYTNTPDSSNLMPVSFSVRAKLRNSSLAIAPTPSSGFTKGLFLGIRSFTYSRGRVVRPDRKAPEPRVMRAVVTPRIVVPIL